jgi:hypothetical protein
LARAAWALTSNGKENSKILVFCHSRDTAAATNEVVEKLAKGNKKEGVPERIISPQLFLGGRRVLERKDTADWLKDHFFLAGSESRPSLPTFVFATSAGEVGVDLDADHMVCDLVTWERMVQRLGRVNRRGEGSAKVIVIREPDPPPSKAAEKARMFDETRAREWFAALDYGFTHYTVCLLGCTDGDGNVFVVDEHAERLWLPQRHAAAIRAMVGRHVVANGKWQKVHLTPALSPSDAEREPARGHWSFQI